MRSLTLSTTILALLLLGLPLASCGGDDLCSEGNCICESNVTGCSFHCAGGSCSQSCQPGSSCVVECEKGGCIQNCQLSATCDLRCAGGGCTQSCSGNTKCKSSCSGGNCLTD